MRDPVPLGCYGNKYLELKRIREFLGDCKPRTFVEPFCGSAVVARAMYDLDPTVRVHINDLEEHRIGFYQILADDEKRRAWREYEHAVIDGGKAAYRAICCEKTLAGFVIPKRIYSFTYGVFPAEEKALIRKKAPVADGWVRFLKHATITCRDWRAVADEYKDDATALIFLDPPYFSSDNSTYRRYTADGRFTDSTQIYLDLLDFLRTAKARVFMIINDTALLRHLYGEYASPPYEKAYSNTVGATRQKNKTTHMFVSNFWGATSPLPPPS